MTALESADETEAVTAITFLLSLVIKRYIKLTAGHEICTVWATEEIYTWMVALFYVFNKLVVVWGWEGNPSQ